MIPSIAVVQMHNPYWKSCRLWIPLFLLWIPLALLSPLILLVLLVACLAGRVSFWRAIAVFWAIACSLPGTHVRVTNNGKQILVRIL